MSLYEKRVGTVIVAEAVPNATAAESSELDISNEPVVVMHIRYEADGASKTLRLYPEVRIVVAGTAVWVPALSASLDVAGATIDAEGYLPLDGASPILDVPGISGVEVAVTLHIPVPTGDRFRVRYLEDGYAAPAPATLSIYAAAARGAS